MSAADAVVAGVDGSDPAVDAVRWAARAAARGSGRLRLVTAFGWMPVDDGDDPTQLVPDARDELRRSAERHLSAAAAEAAVVAPGVDVTTAVLRGYPATVLVEESATARLVVVGHRGLGGFTGLLVGSVGTALAAHARCPVVVVRGAGDGVPAPEGGPVVVGVAGSSRGESALAFAVDAAVSLGVPLVAVHAWQDVVVDAVDMIEAERTRRWSSASPRGGSSTLSSPSSLRRSATGRCGRSWSAAPGPSWSWSAPAVAAASPGCCSGR